MCVYAKVYVCIYIDFLVLLAETTQKPGAHTQHPGLGFYQPPIKGTGTLGKMADSRSGAGNI